MSDEPASIYLSVYYDQLEELYVAIADLKTKMNDTLDNECRGDDDRYTDVDAGPCRSFDV